MTVTQTSTDIYPSRNGQPAGLTPRQDPIVYGDADSGPLNETQVEAYDRDGFLLLPEVLSRSEIDLCREELRRLAASEEIKSRPEAILEPERRDLRSLFAVHRISELFGRLAADQRLCGIARQLLGSEVYIHQARINLKPGFVGKEFYWHSDFETWHVEDGMPRMRAVSCSILLTDNHEQNGPLMLIPGSHRHFVVCAGQTPENHYEQSLRRQEYGVPDSDSMAELAQQGGITTATGKAGSVAFFECNTMHGSNSNITPDPRSNAFFVYNSVENKLNDPYCGLPPRPEHIASRQHTATLKPAPFAH